MYTLLKKYPCLVRNLVQNKTNSFFLILRYPLLYEQVMSFEKVSFHYLFALSLSFSLAEFLFCVIFRFNSL